MSSKTKLAKSVKKTRTKADAKNALRETSDSKAHIVSSVERAFKILEELAATSKMWGLTFTELKDRTGISKSTLSYLLYTLTQHGYLRYNEGKKIYNLGMPLMGLGERVKIRLQVEVPKKECRELLKHIVDETKLGAHIALWDSGYAVYLWRVESPGFFTAKIWSGKSQIPHITAVGKALICCYDKNQLQAVLDMHHISKDDFPNAITSLSSLEKDLATVCQRGYAVDNEEHAAGVRCIAAPVYAAPNKVVAAIGVSGNTEEIPLSRIKEIGEVLREEADKAAKKSLILNALLRYERYI
jgi:DNA-binding IclR family transcriptional regulator